MDVATNPYNPNEFITVGVKHMKFWTYDPKLGKLEEHKGLFEKEGPQVSYLLLLFFFCYALKFKLLIHSLTFCEPELDLLYFPR